MDHRLNFYWSTLWLEEPGVQVLNSVKNYAFSIFSFVVVEHKGKCCLVSYADQKISIL